MLKFNHKRILNKNNHNHIPVSEYHQPKKILITGGIGDIFAIESHFPESWYSSVQKIVLATRASKFIYDLFKNKNFPFYNAEIEIVETDYRHPIHNINQLVQRTNYTDIQNLVDCSISKIFPLIKKNILHYKGCSVLHRIEENLDKFNLPEKYVVICPITNDDVTSPRSFTKQEQQIINKFLNTKKVTGVVLHHQKYEYLNSPYIMNLTGLTTLAESINILNNSYGFIGVDSCLTVLACQLFQPHSIMIKSKNLHLYNNLKPYTSPLITRKILFQVIHNHKNVLGTRNELIILK